MKKIMILILICLILLIGCAKEPLVGGSCGTVSPDYRDECCERQMKGAIHIMCVGDWKYNMENNNCEFVCETEEIK